MPMIEFRYHAITLEEACAIPPYLETGLRSSIRAVRPEKGDDYGVTVEGDPFGPAILHQPALRIYIFYHEGWNFTEEELGRVAQGMREKVDRMLKELKLPMMSSKIRFYQRAGHVSA